MPPMESNQLNNTNFAYPKPNHNIMTYLYNAYHWLKCISKNLMISGNYMTLLPLNLKIREYIGFGTVRKCRFVFIYSGQYRSTVIKNQIATISDRIKVKWDVPFEIIDIRQIAENISNVER